MLIKQARVSRKHLTRQSIAVGKQFGKDSYFIMAKLREGMDETILQEKKKEICKYYSYYSTPHFCLTVLPSGNTS